MTLIPERPEAQVKTIAIGSTELAYLDMGQVNALLDSHQNRVQDATDRIWRLLNLQLWGEIHLKGNRERWWDVLVAGKTGASRMSATIRP